MQQQWRTCILEVEIKDGDFEDEKMAEINSDFDDENKELKI